MLWAGVASESGSSVTKTVLFFVTYAATQSGSAVALIAISQTVAGVVFSMPMGTLVDRYDRKMLMVLSDVVRAASIGALGLFMLFAGFNLFSVIASSFVMSAVGSIFYPAERALLPSLIPRDLVANANGLICSSRRSKVRGIAAYQFNQPQRRVQRL